MMNEARPTTADSPPKDKVVVIQVLACPEPCGKWSALTLELLGDASALARRWAGRVGAWVLIGPDGPPADLTELAAHGCEVVHHLKSERFAGWSSEAVAAALAGHTPPGCRVVVLPGGARGEEAAALLAEHLQTTWVPDALTLSV